jgi:glucose-1-phosphate thymidylyltransferase
MNVIIPMAGMGKRMRPHSITTPKPLIPIAGKPMVHRIVEDIIATTSQKVNNIAFICGRFGQEAEESLLQVAKDLGATGKIYYQDTPQGTAHAILCAAEQLNGPVFIAFADTLFDADFKLDTSKDAIIWTQKVADPSAFGVVQLNADGVIENFIEKPQEFISDLAIIGVYYFKDGENLRNELQFLLDNEIKNGLEYQITDAMINMKNKGIKFYCDQVKEWLDCGNKDAVVYTNQRVLHLKQNKEELQHKSANVTGSIIHQPCFIGEGAVIVNSVIGPNTSIEAHASITNSIVKNSIIRNNTNVKDAILNNSMIGSFVTYTGSAKYSNTANEVSLGDYSVQL